MPLSNLDASGINVDLIANATLAEGERVTVNSSGKAIQASATQRHIGTIVRGGAAGDTVSVNTPAGVKFAVNAAVAIAVGDPLYPAASGRVTNVAGSAPFDYPYGIALSAATVAGGETFRYLPYEG